MRNSSSLRKLRRLTIIFVAFAALSVLPILSTAQPSTSVTIVNNSAGVIRHVYVSPVNSEDWSGDQLNNSAIAQGQSVTISNFACNQSQMRVIGENQDGCFVSKVISCGANVSWTITTSEPADCGQ